VGGLAQSVWRPATGWKVERSNPDVARFSSTAHTSLGPSQSPVNWVTGLFLGVERLRRVVKHPTPPSKVKLSLYRPGRVLGVSGG
jgi:hypothetical protein